jgi:hypothetical protein
VSKPAGVPLVEADRGALLELAPLLRRAVNLEPAAVVRLRLGDGAATALIRLPFRVLVSRTVVQPPRAEPLDAAAPVADVLDWLDGIADSPPQRRDADWRTALPPAAGWRPVESVPDHVVRPLVRKGALALKDAAAREGVPGAQPRAEVADALLDATVLTVTGEPGSAEVTLRALSALTRMGFLPRGGRVRVDTAGRWIRVVAEYGTVYLERAGTGLQLL